MARQPWDDGLTTDEILAFAGEHDAAMLVSAIADPLEDRDDEGGRLSNAERYVVAIYALQREVNNGGYSQFFLNSSGAYADVIEAALVAIGCPVAAAITRDAVRARGNVAKVEPRSAGPLLSACDDRFFALEERLNEKLLAWIQANRTQIHTVR